MKIMDYLTKDFAPKMNCVCSRPWIAGVSGGMQKIIPFILTGSVVYFYNVFRSWIPSLPNLGFIADYSFGLISLILAFSIGQQCMEKLGLHFYTTNCGIVSICVFIMLIMPTSDEMGNMIFSSGRMGASGIAVAIIAGIFTAVVFNFYSKLHILENSTSIPDFIAGWVNCIIPTIVCLSMSMVVTQILHIDIFNLILSIFKPLVGFAQTLPGFILICFIPCFMYVFGINGWLFAAISTPIFLSAIQENIDAVSVGLPALNITTNETVFTTALVTMGGVGATLAFNILMLRSKSKKLKTLGKIFIGPSLFNINEPIVYGTPMVLNPILMIPMLINSIVGSAIVYIVMSLGWLNIPSKLLFVGQIPVPFGAFLATEDIRGILWAVILFVIYTIIWYPFFKAYERQCLEEEIEGNNE